MKKKSNFSILVVDDDITTLSVVKKFLNIDGYNNITYESDVVQAAKICKKKSFDILIIDIVMPRMSGVQLLSTLNFKPIVICISSYPEYVENYQEIFDYIIQKPFTRQQFIDTFNEIEYVKKQV